MVDDGGTFGGTAAREMEEELEMVIEEGDLTDLTEMALSLRETENRKDAGGQKSNDDGDGSDDLPKGMFPSAGSCDEYIPLFLHERRVPRETLKEWEGKLTGLRSEGEKITLKMVRLEDLWWVGARDAKVLGAWALWEGLRRRGMLR